MSTLAYIGLGANLGDAAATLHLAITALGALPNTQLRAQSPFYRSAPVGYLDQPDFVNAVACIETGLTPHQVLAALLQIEAEHGRARSFRNAPRTLDMDLLLYGSEQLHDERLTVPHPRMLERGFVLQPLADIAPDDVLASSLQQPSLATCLQRISTQDLHRLPHSTPQSPQ